jgi:hypothetical protein
MPEPAPPALPAPAPDPAVLPPPPAAGRADPLGRDTGRRAELRRLRREWLAERDVARRRARAKRPWQMLLLLALGLSLAPATVAVSSRTRLDPTAVAMATRFLCPHGGTLVPGLRGRCRPPGATMTARAGGGGGMAGWDFGLRAANRRQMECPDGTYAVPVPRGAAASIRCVPR